MRKSSLIIICIFLVTVVFAQKIIPIRLEVPWSMDVSTFNVESLGEKGVLIFYESNELGDDEMRKWYFGLFNTKMKQQWLKFVSLSDKIEFVESKQVGDKLHLFFRNSTRTRTDQGFYEIINYQISTGEFTKVSGSIPEKVSVAGFEVIGNTGCLALNLKNEDADLLFINLVDGNIKPVRIEEENINQINNVHADGKNKRFYTVVKTIKDKRYVYDEIFQFSENGTLEKKYKIENIQTIKLLRDFIFMPAGKNELKIVGTYDIITEKVSSFRDINDQEEAKGAGMFFLQFKGDQQQTLKFHDFLSFDNVYNSLGSRDVDYTKSKNDDDKSQAKTLTAFYYMIGPEVIKVNDQYVFSVEVYKPFYRAETRMDYDYYGRPMPYTYNVFDGFKFYDLILAGLSENGDLVWNNDFALRDLKTYELKRNSIVFEDGNFVSMAYVNNGEIYAQTIEGMVDIGSSETTIETKLNKDRISDDDNNHLLHWYDDFFLIYGYQKLNNRTLGDQSIRTVFYANKIAYK